jgi:hypothetical protein
VVRGRIPRAGGRREQGVVLGLTQSITSVSQIVEPVIAGSLIERGHLGAWALATAGVALRHDKKGNPSRRSRRGSPRPRLFSTAPWRRSQLVVGVERRVRLATQLPPVGPVFRVSIPDGASQPKVI